MRTETEIANKALDLLGIADVIAAGALRIEQSRNATILARAYDECRRAEMRRNVWQFAIRTQALRAVGDFSKNVVYGAWSAVATYAVNDVVLGSDSNVYSSTVASNLNNDPTISPTQWTSYFGNVLAQEYVMTWSNAITYDLRMHAVGSDGQVYRSIVDTNLNHNPVGDSNVHWSVATTVDATDLTQADNQNYYSGEVVYVGRNVYMSKVNANATDPGASSWLIFTTSPTLTDLNFIYPIGVGPTSQTSTKNAFALPNGFLRMAPQDPKQGSALFLGAPTALKYTDWNLESRFITTRDAGPILLRFSADVADIPSMDPMFKIGFASRLAIDTCEALTQNDTKAARAKAEYKDVMTEARLVNGIETGPTEPPEDSYIDCRY